MYQEKKKQGTERPELHCVFKAGSGRKIKKAMTLYRRVCLPRERQITEGSKLKLMNDLAIICQMRPGRRVRKPWVDV